MPYVETNGIETYCERRGDGPPVVFVHGSMVDHTQWAPQAEALADEYTTVTYDLRGHGRTGPSSVPGYSMNLFVADLDALVSALDLERPVLCGLSMGGAVAQVYAATHPEKVSGVVLADAFTATRSDPRDHLQWALMRAAILPVRLVGFDRVNRANVRLQERFNRGSGGDRETLETLVADAPPMATAEFAKVVRAMTDFVGGTVNLAAISAPTLVLYGEHDVGMIKRHSRELHATIPDADLREVPGGGHAANLDNPDFFTAALREFLAERAFPDATDVTGAA